MARSSQPRGRPRLAETDDGLLKAAYAELAQKGYRGFAMEAVARRAGASKATLYRRWGSAADLLLAALTRQSALTVPLHHTGHLKTDLKGLLMSSFRRLNRGTGKLIRSLMAESQLDDAFRKKFRDTFIQSRRAGLRSIFEAAISRGDLPPAFDREFALDVIYGVMWYRLLLGHAPLNEACADHLIEMVTRLDNAR